MLGKLGGRIAVVAVAIVTVVALPTAAGAASYTGPNVSVGPRQYFVGLEFGLKAKPNVVNVNCAGPATTGHPAAGQRVEVLLVLPPIVPTDGYTGTLAKRIQTNLVWPVGPVLESAFIANFTSYAVKLAIPTKITVPCSGTGQMVYTPMPTSNTAKSSVISVTFQSTGV